jgi:hypothetical protein
MSEENGNKQVSVSWKYMTQVLLGVVIVGGGWFCNLSWGKVQEHETAITRLTDQMQENTKALDRLTVRFDNLSAQLSQNNLNGSKRGN